MNLESRTSDGQLRVPGNQGVTTVSGFSSAGLAFVPLPVALLLLAMLLPSELDFSVGGIRLSGQRLVLLAFLPIALARLITGAGPKFRSFDFFFLAAITYFAFAVFYKEALNKAIQSGGIFFVEAVGGYLLARVYVRNAQQFLATVKFLFVMVLIVGAMALLETLLSDHIARNLAAAISGAPPVLWKEYRMGLLRATSVFDHPIHYGVFCAIVFGLIWFTETDVRRRLFRASLAGGAAFLSLSAGPLQGIALILVGACWERATRRLPNRLLITAAASVVLYAGASLLTKRSLFEAITTRLVIDSDSYWYRMQIWDYGVTNVQNSPWVGVPLGTWERPEWMASGSVDNHWLALAMWGGVPTVTLYILAILTLLSAVHRGVAAPEPPELRGIRYSWTATVLALCVMGATVQYWVTLGILFTFCLGLGGWLADAPQPSVLQVNGPDRRRVPVGAEVRMKGAISPYRRA